MPFDKNWCIKLIDVSALEGIPGDLHGVFYWKDFG